MNVDLTSGNSSSICSGEKSVLNRTHGPINRILLSVLINIFVGVVAANAGSVWTSSDNISGGNGCGAARAQAVITYGAHLCNHGCSINGNTASDINTSNSDAGYCFPGDPIKSAGGYRNGYAFLGCTDGQTLVDGECIDPDQVTRQSKGGGYCSIGNPIDPITGVKTEYALDFTTSGSTPLKIERYYASNVTQYADNLAKSQIGYGWKTNFDARAIISTECCTAPTTYVVQPNGQRFVFKQNSDKTWSSAFINTQNSTWTLDNSGSAETLSSVGANYEFSDAQNTVWVFNTNGILAQIRFNNGYTQNISYVMNVANTAPISATVTDSFNRQITFSYSVGGLLLSATTPAGVINYSYVDRIDQNFIQTYLPAPSYNPTLVMYQPVLSQVTHSGQSTSNFTYLYEDDSNRTGLTGIVDERGVRYATFAYDKSGYALSTTHAGGSNNYSLSYDKTGLATTVTNPLGKNTVYNYIINQGRRQFTGLQGQASTNCPSSATSVTYDNSGFIASSKDEEGRLTTYTRDNKGRPLTIINGSQ